MKIKYCQDYNEMSQLASDSIISGLQKRPGQLLCAASGNSPTGTYERLTKVFENDPGLFKDLSLVKLDEWVGIAPNAPSSCESYIQNKIVRPLRIPKERYISFKSNPVSPKEECKRMQLELDQKGPIDLCVLGLGQNGHIGFNEPASELVPNCHVAELTSDSLEHQMINSLDRKPNYGLTLGMADILSSIKIILLVTGSNKQAVLQKLLSKRITTSLPASFLWLQDQVECYIDSNTA